MYESKIERRCGTNLNEQAEVGEERQVSRQSEQPGWVGLT